MAKMMIDCKWKHPDCCGYNKRNGQCAALGNTEFARADCPFYNSGAKRNVPDHPITREQAAKSVRRQSPCQGCSFAENDGCNRTKRCESFRVWVGDALRAMRKLTGVTR